MSDDRPYKRARISVPEPISDAASQVFALLGFSDDEYQTPQQATFNAGNAVLLRHIISQSDDPLETHRQLIATNRDLQDWARANPVAHQTFLDSFLTVETTSDATYYMYKGRTHRIGRPASVYTDGSFGWWRNGRIHRTNGPAERDIGASYTLDEYAIDDVVVRETRYKTNGDVYTTYFGDSSRRTITREQAEVLYAKYPAILEEYQTPPPQ